MSQTIKTYKDLCDEREKMKSLLVIQRQRVKDDWYELKNEFLPFRNALGMVGKFTTRDKSNPLVNAGLKMAGDIFLKNFVLAKAGWATKLAVPFVVKNYSSHLLVERGASILGKVVRLFKGKRTGKLSARRANTPQYSGPAAAGTTYTGSTNAGHFTQGVDPVHIVDPAKPAEPVKPIPPIEPGGTSSMG